VESCPGPVSFFVRFQPSAVSIQLFLGRTELDIARSHLAAGLARRASHDEAGFRLWLIAES
jgi:hypothetical protein